MHLTKRYKRKLAVDDLSFDVQLGKVTGFLGPNGAGKSTTMRLMLGLDKGGGETTFDGKKLYEYPRPSSVVGVLLEAKAFHPTRSSRSHLRALAALGDVPFGRVEEVLKLVGLEEVAKKPPGKFSLGMSQRLGIAAAILAHPKYLLLDEPANGLDPEGIKWLRDFLKAYADEGNAVFVSSHLLSEMSLMADNVIVIGKGKLIANTPISKLISGSPHSRVFVRSTKLSELQKILKVAKLDCSPEEGGLVVNGATTDAIGKIMASHKLTVLELAPRTASLEDAFFELTENAEEYRTHTEGSAR